MEETDAEEHWQLFMCQKQILIIADICEHLKQQITGILGGHLEDEEFKVWKFGEHVHGVSFLEDDSEEPLYILTLASTDT